MSLQTLLLWDVSFSHKTHRKKTSRRKRECEIFTTTCVLVSYKSHYLLLTHRGLISSSRLSMHLSGFSECVHERTAEIQLFRSSRAHRPDFVITSLIVRQ